MATSIVKQQLSGIPASIPEGGTGAKTKANAQTNLGIHPAIYINPNDVLRTGSYSSTAKSYTATKDCFFYSLQSSQRSTATTATVYINDSTTNLVRTDSDSGTNVRVSIAMGYLKKGDKITYADTTIKILGLRT